MADKSPKGKIMQIYNGLLTRSGKKKFKANLVSRNKPD
ncbi:MAG: hypothetical protein AVDCRST_MAG95-2779 [uncultured Adhaeribacter sp.]|uniref:Uncharacterized protein n=1 Tax=uncultured Adhaeribacter sp. TaxID=448109 RepID=A0A6J4JAN3_9BACT|nr:MAG: hypothetical protein AVDCRST_MAG95-2779 [uncultured Adhaeribacter sp.]